MLRCGEVRRTIIRRTTRQQETMANPIVISGDWYDSETAARELGVTIRTLQKWAQRGHLQFKTVNQDRRRTRLYTVESVQKFRDSGPREERKPQAPRPITNELVATRRGASPKAEKQEIRALDMVSIVGKVMIVHKDEIKLLADQMERMQDRFSKSLETVVGMVLNNQKAEADANRERLKAEREDNRERWELDRQDRLDRRKAARAASTKAQAKPVAAAKARRAHA